MRRRFGPPCRTRSAAHRTSFFWRSLGDSNPCFRRERANWRVLNASAFEAFAGNDASISCSPFWASPRAHSGSSPGAPASS